MERAPNISKQALIAEMNRLRQRRAIVDTKYERFDGNDRLVLIYDDGSREVFKGLRAA